MNDFQYKGGKIMKYFNEKTIESLEDLKKAYKENVMKLHPDISGTDTTAQFQDMQNEYEELFKRVKNTRRNSKGETYHKETTETPEEFKEVLENIIHFKNVKIEIKGCWIWLSGSGTLEHIEELKAKKFFYSGTHKSWYYSGDDTKKHKRSHYTMEQINETFGNIEVKNDIQLELQGA